MRDWRTRITGLAWLLVCCGGQTSTPGKPSEKRDASIPSAGGSTGQGGMDAPCALNSDCEGVLVCISARCHSACAEARDCPAPQRCVTLMEGSTCLLPTESHCTHNSECSNPLVCARDLACRNPCDVDRDCIKGQRCATSHVCADPADLDPSGDVKSAG